MEKDYRQLSFEFFPTKTDRGKEKLQKLAKKLKQFSPEYFSVTFGAGGSTREGTLNTCLALLESKVQICPHISGIGVTKDSIKEIVEKYLNNGMNRLVVLRGDLPSGIGSVGDFPFALDLINYLKKIGEDKLEIEISAYPEIHPEAENEDSDFQNFLNKVNAGAHGAITQFFFDPGPFFSFMEKCAKNKVSIPVIPGIMPIHNAEALLRMATNCGANIPAWLKEGMEKYNNEKDFINYGIEVISSLCEKLLDFGVSGIHFYTVNREEPTKSIIRNLNFTK